MTTGAATAAALPRVRSDSSRLPKWPSDPRLPSVKLRMRNKLLLLAISAALPLSFYGVARVATAQIEASATASVPLPPRVLSDFGSAAEIARFERRGVDAAHFVSVPGGGAARVTFVKYRPGGI